MTMGTPQSEQGQTVEYSYGWSNGSLYRRMHDRSDGTIRWYVADDDSAAAIDVEDFGGQTHPPRVAEWTECAEPSDDDEGRWSFVRCR